MKTSILRFFDGRQTHPDTFRCDPLLALLRHCPNFSAVKFLLHDCWTLSVLGTLHPGEANITECSMLKMLDQRGQ